MKELSFDLNTVVLLFHQSCAINNLIFSISLACLTCLLFKIMTVFPNWVIDVISWFLKQFGSRLRFAHYSACLFAASRRQAAEG